MRAIVSDGRTGADGLSVTTLPDPRATAGRMTVRVHAAGVSYSDLLMARGAYQRRQPPPHTLGGELAGTVVDVAPASPFRVGDRVAAIGQTGAFAELCAVDEGWAAPVPEGLDWVEAASLANHQTVAFALGLRACGVRPRAALVLGAGGGVGAAAIELLAADGVAVVAATRRPRDGERLRSLGAARVVPLEGLADDAPEVDVVVDPIGGDYALAALRCLRPGGVYLTLGFAAGSIPRLALNRLLLKNVAVSGVGWGEWLRHSPEALAEVNRSLGERIAAGWRPRVDEVHRGLAGVPDALARMAAGRHIGKQVIDMQVVDGSAATPLSGTSRTPGRRP